MTTLSNAKVKVLTSMKGLFDDSKPVGIYPHAVGLKEVTPTEHTTYIFFIKYAGNAATPYIVLKLLPPTADRVLALKKLILAGPRQNSG